MKQFIVMIAVMPLLLLFMMQFAAQQNTDGRIQLINEAVHNSCEKAKLEGRFSDDIVSEMKNRLAEITGCNENSIKVEVSSDIHYRTGGYDEREMIDYRILVPVSGVVAMPGLFGISDEDNGFVYELRNSIPSERLR